MMIHACILVNSAWHAASALWGLQRMLLHSTMHGQPGWRSAPVVRRSRPTK